MNLREIGAWLLALLTAVVSVFYMGSRRGRRVEREKGARATDKAEDKGQEAMLDGLKHEQEASNEKVDPDRYYFDK